MIAAELCEAVQIDDADRILRMIGVMIVEENLRREARALQRRSEMVTHELLLLIRRHRQTRLILRIERLVLRRYLDRLLRKHQSAADYVPAPVVERHAGAQRRAARG